MAILLILSPWHAMPMFILQGKKEYWKRQYVSFPLPVLVNNLRKEKYNTGKHLRYR